MTGHIDPTKEAFAVFRDIIGPVRSKCSIW